jgi:large subunit ribosomal protein L3
MATVFDEEGRQVPVTVIQAGPCSIVQVKRKTTDGYDAVQLGFGNYPPGHEKVGGSIPRGRAGNRAKGRPSKPVLGTFAKRGLKPQRHLAEFRFAPGAELRIGEEVQVDLFQAGEEVKVSGVSKGKGFAGVMRRHHFSGQGASHGAKIHRKPASVGATDPARVFKGKRMPGHMGNARVTVRGLRVVEVDRPKNLLLVRGAVPGANGGLLRIEAD